MQAKAIPSFLLYGDDAQEAPSDFAHIETIATRSALLDWEISPHRHMQSGQVLLVSSGQVHFRCDGMQKDLDAPCFMVVTPGSVHGFRFSPDTRGHVLSFSASLAARARGAGDPLLHLLTHGGSGTIPGEVLARVDWLCAEMLAIQDDWRALQPLFLALTEALLRSLPGEERAGSDASDDRVAQFRALVELHLAQHRPLSWYADRLGMTERTLNRLCRRQLGMTPVQLIHARITQEAQRMLCFTNASIQQVSDELGFSDASYFSRFYHRMTGRRPTLDRM